ncbi:MAG: acyl-CoA dehydrogenase protein [Marmoricola sp.]|nr:acyl-CoA dehydrogenase protein [Marmoricola sp.]
METLEETTWRAREWFEARVPRRADSAARSGKPWSVAIFPETSHVEERVQLDEARAWLQAKWSARLAGLDWPEAFGGHGLGRAYADAVSAVEADYDVPHHDLLPITTRLVAPMLRLLGTEEQKARYVGPLARSEIVCAQLFSEPSAGSDLAGISTRARHSPDGTWSVTGQKVWSSGAQFADYGLLLTRTDVDAVKHAGITAFLLPLDTPGVDIRPLRQMTGGACFNELFLDDVPVSDDYRVGNVGDGWKVATTMLGFERDASGDDTTLGGSWIQVLSLAAAMSKTSDPVVRPLLADVYARHLLAKVNVARDLSDRSRGLPRGPEGSMRKLQWVEGMVQISEAVSQILGPRLVADTGDPETFGWNSHVLGALGYRIAGGSNEIQRTIIAERVLGLPPGPRVDRGIPFRDIPTS